MVDIAPASSATGSPAVNAHSSRVPSLDGLRAISLALVVFDHLCISHIIPFHQTWVDCGNLGVRIFFVVSGFIITLLLLEEQQKTGRISLCGFYIRRCFRILPMWACYIAAALVALFATHRPPPLRDLFGVLTFNADWLRSSTVDFSHLWSLSVEEKFYLIWPLVIIFSRRKVALIVALSSMVVLPLVRAYSALHGASYEDLLYPFYVTADAIATGCCLALVRGRLHRTASWQKFLHSRWAWLTPAFIVGIAALHKTGLPFWVFGVTALNVCVALFLDLVISRPDSAVGALLNSPVFIAVGIWSYGLYLWQQPLCFHLKGGVVSIFPMNLLVLLALASAGYYSIERPAQNFGRRLAKRLNTRAELAIVR